MSSPAHLTVRPDGGVPLELLVRDRLPVGRAGRGLLLADDRVSRHHCEFRVADGTLSVRDTGSSNGTFVNGERVEGTRNLRDGDVVQIGDTRIDVGPPAPLDRIPATAGAPPLGETVVGSLGPPGALDEPTTVGTSVPAAEADQLRASIVGSTLTLVFSDIIDSTVLVTRFGDQRWLEHLQRHDRITRDGIERFHGTEVKGQGDGFLLTFPSARHALLFAITLQTTLRDERERDPGFPIHVRVGVHTGEVLHASGDVFGRHVHRAARISSLAGRDEIIASSLVRELAESMGDIAFGEPETVELKGFDGHQVVHRIAWSDTT